MYSYHFRQKGKIYVCRISTLKQVLLYSNFVKLVWLVRYIFYKMIVKRDVYFRIFRRNPKVIYQPSRGAIGSPVLGGDVGRVQARRGRRVKAGGRSVEERGGAGARAGGTITIELGRGAPDTGCGGTAATGAARVSPVRRVRHWTRAVRHRYGARLPATMVRHCVSRLVLTVESLSLRRVPEIHFCIQTLKNKEYHILLIKYYEFFFKYTHTFERLIVPRVLIMHYTR